MKIAKQRTVFLVVGFVLLFGLACTVFAGEGGPPGDYKYAPPPYQGQLSCIYSDPYLDVCGRVDQLGQTGKFIDFGNEATGCYRAAYTEYFPGDPKPFEELTSKDLQGIWFIYDTAEADYAIQILGVGKLYWNETKTRFDAGFVMMEMVK